MTSRVNSRCSRSTLPARQRPDAECRSPAPLESGMQPSFYFARIRPHHPLHAPAALRRERFAHPGPRSREDPFPSRLDRKTVDHPDESACRPQIDPGERHKREPFGKKKGALQVEDTCGAPWALRWDKWGRCVCVSYFPGLPKLLIHSNFQILAELTSSSALIRTER